MGAGAPPKYNQKYHDPWAFSLACEGKTDEEIAEAFGIARRTIDRWKYETERKKVQAIDENGRQVLDENGKPVFKTVLEPITDENGEKKLSSFGEELFKGKHIADSQIEQSLYKLGNGYTYEEKEEIVEVGTDGRPKPLRIRKTTKYIPPNVTAQIFWLKNRRPSAWRDRIAGDFTVTTQNYEALNKAFEALKGEDEK